MQMAENKRHRTPPSMKRIHDLLLLGTLGEVAELLNDPQDVTKARVEQVT